MIKLPETLGLDGYSYEQITLGKSFADVYKFTNGSETLYLKCCSNEIDLLRMERDVMLWLNGKLIVPEPRRWSESDGSAYLLMTEVKGNVSCDSKLMTPENIDKTVSLLAEGLKLLQSIDISDCPFDHRLDVKLREALYSIENRLVDMDDFEEENDFDTHMDLYQWLAENRPPEDLSFCHGDYCLPNIIFNGDMIGFIDINTAGIADKWQDIALCVRSLGYNLTVSGLKPNENHYADYLFECLGISPNWEKINYYILLDELF